MVTLPLRPLNRGHILSSPVTGFRFSGPHDQIPPKSHNVFNRLPKYRGSRPRSLAKVAMALQERASGEMAEWLKAHAWKACVRETVPWVRIPLSPPLIYSSEKVLQKQALLKPVHLDGGAPRWSTPK